MLRSWRGTGAGDTDDHYHSIHDVLIAIGGSAKDVLRVLSVAGDGSGLHEPQSPKAAWRYHHFPLSSRCLRLSVL